MVSYAWWNKCRRGGYHGTSVARRAIYQSAVNKSLARKISCPSTVRPDKKSETSCISPVKQKGSYLSIHRSDPSGVKVNGVGRLPDITYQKSPPFFRSSPYLQNRWIESSGVWGTGLTRTRVIRPPIVRGRIPQFRGRRKGLQGAPNPPVCVSSYLRIWVAPRTVGGLREC